jgi:hypothetical protein
VATIAGLEELDGRLLDGLTFCRRVYRLMHRIRSTSSGIRELRLRKSPRAKRLVEELLPLASYVQTRYSASRTLRVRWMGGNQGFDARIFWSGPAVENLGLPRVRHVEVTTAGRANAYLVRELVDTEGGSFSSKGTYRDRQTRRIVSRPVVEERSAAVRELAALVAARIVEKNGKPYPAQTSLVVSCEFESPLDPGEWRELLEIVRRVPNAFAEVVLVDEPMYRVDTL